MGLALAKAKAVLAKQAAAARTMANLMLIESGWSFLNWMSSDSKEGSDTLRIIVTRPC